MDLRDQLQITLGDAYALERELGGGGMSRVFVAEERALGRKVVVKVLSPDLAVGVSSERFAREIRVAARLQQANIVPLLTAGEAAGLPYYTMPFVDGQSLRGRLAEGALPIAEAVNVLRDVARALSYAHERGVIHRDIKPENVLLSGGAAVVTDFGIAKAIAASRTAGATETLTSVGSTLGTPAYMAPEQALADPAADHRADIYAFGCLAYELLTGRSPFHGRPAQQQLVAHVHESVPAVESLRSETPRELAALVARCLSKDPEARPHNAREILETLDNVTTPVPAVSIAPRRPAPVGMLVAAAAAVGVVGLMAWGVRARAHSAQPVNGTPRALAVLPFANVGADSAQEYLAEGIAVDLSNALSKVPGLRVTSHSLTMPYKGPAVDVRTVGRELNVEAVVEGTVQRSGDRLRVTTQLTRTADGVAIWSDRYERDLKDLLAVQDGITKAIVGELRLTLSGSQSAGRSSVGTANFDAYDSYLRGVYLLEHRGPGVTKAIEYFNDAIAQDSGLARAWGALSEALELLPYFAQTPASAVEARAVSAAQRALSLDSSVTEAYIGIGLARDHAFRWNEAEVEFRRAVAIDSASGVAHTQFGRHLLYRGRIREAVDEFRRATQVDPVSGTPVAWLAHAYSLMGQHDSALAIGRRARERDPGLILNRAFGAKDAIAAGRPDLARTLVSGLDASVPWRGEAVYCLGMLGDTAAVRAAIRDFQNMPSDTWLVHTALLDAYLGLRDTASALAELERAVAAHEITAHWDGFPDPMFDPIRASPRFAAAVRAFGLDERLMTTGNGGRPR